MLTGTVEGGGAAGEGAEAEPRHQEKRGSKRDSWRLVLTQCVERFGIEYSQQLGEYHPASAHAECPVCDACLLAAVADGEPAAARAGGRSLRQRHEFDRAAGMTGATGNVYCGLHEFEDMALVLHALRPRDLFVDVGANVGSYTVLGGQPARVALASNPSLEPSRGCERILPSMA